MSVRYLAPLPPSAVLRKLAALQFHDEDVDMITNSPLPPSQYPSIHDNVEDNEDEDENSAEKKNSEK
eukprot:8743400-Ditylum_brightwellii.AAC.1